MVSKHLPKILLLIKLNRLLFADDQVIIAKSERTYRKQHIMLSKLVFCLQNWRWKQYIPPKHWCLPTSPHSVTAQKTNIDIFNAVTTSNLTYAIHKLIFVSKTSHWIKQT
jgi:hypothetical protein